MLLWAANGGLWTYGSRITLSFVPDGTNVGGVSSNLYSTLNAVAPTATWQAAFVKAAQYWASYAHINMSLVPDSGDPIGTAGNQQGDPRFGDIRIAMIPQSGGILAYAMLPPPYNGGSDAGDVVLNSNVCWQVGADYDLQTVATHEIGHALGMDHSALATADMYAYYNGLKQSLTTDDVAGIQYVYGAFPTDTDTNRSFTTATNITPLIDGNSQIAVAGLNLSGGQDADYFAVTVPATTNGTMSVSMQTAGLSLATPKLSVYNGAKSPLANVSLPNSYGATATVTLTGVTPGQVYYFRTAGASGLGSYGAYGLLVNFGSAKQAPIAPPNTAVAQQPSKGGDSENQVQGPTVLPWSPNAPILHPADLVTDLWSGLGTWFGWFQPQIPIIPAVDTGLMTLVLNKHVAYGEALMATVPARTVPAFGHPSGPLASFGSDALGPRQSTVVVNLHPGTATGFGAPGVPLARSPQVFAPWTGTAPQSSVTTPGLPGAADQVFIHGRSPWPQFHRHRRGG